MKRYAKILGVLAVLAFLGLGCGMVGAPGYLPGTIYVNAVYPQSNGYYNELTPNAKHGEACATAYFGWIAIGDAGVNAAMRAGGISKASTIDFRATNILGLIAKYCAIVSGT